MLALRTVLVLAAMLYVVASQQVDSRAARRSFGRRHIREDEDVISELDSQERSIELNRLSVSSKEQKPSVAETSKSDSSDDADEDNVKESSQDQLFLSQHQARLKAMEDMFEKRQNRMQQSSQELNPISIGLGPPTGFGPKMGLQSPASLGTPNLPFAFGQLPHLLGLQGPSSPSGGVSGAPPPPPSSLAMPAVDGGSDADERISGEDENGDPPQLEPRIGPGGQKIWPKIFRFTDGRANLADFERQKKIRLSNLSHNGDNQIDPAPIIFDGRPLKRRSFLILHGGIF